MLSYYGLGAVEAAAALSRQNLPEAWVDPLGPFLGEPLPRAPMSLWVLVTEEANSWPASCLPFQVAFTSALRSPTLGLGRMSLPEYPLLS